MQHIVMFSGGIGSWAAAKRVVAEHGAANTTLLFSDTKTEDEDLYRFLGDASANIGVPITYLADGRDVWEVFRDKRFLGNSMVDPCSRILKRELADAWLTEHYTPETCIRYIGIDWSEAHRYTRMRDRLLPWTVKAPLCEPPYLTKDDLMAWAAWEGLDAPRLYGMGFSHNNCGGFCVKAGHKQFALLLEKLPERYAYHERKEAELREYLAKDVSILSDRSGGMGKRPLTLTAFRQRLQSGAIDKSSLDPGTGCGCFLDVDIDPELSGKGTI